MTLLVNGEEILDSEIDVVRQQLLMEQEDNPDVEEAGASEAFAKDMVIARVLVKQEATKRAEPVPPAILENALKSLMEQHGGEAALLEQLSDTDFSVDDLKRDLELQLQVDQLLEQVCADIEQPTEQQIREHYDAHPEDFELPEQIHAAHIVKHIQGTVVDMHAGHEEMKGVLETIQQGTPFEEMASKYSDCPDSAGDLGWFPRGAMVPEFEKVVFALEKDQISDVFQTPFGLHIAKVYERIPAKQQDFEEAKEGVADFLYKERENTVIDAFTDELRKNASIEEK
jgi:parvulin-like peptidyl-prolyl isomerase